MALHKIEYDGGSFIVDDRRTYGVYVERAGNFSWRVEVRPGVQAEAVFSLSAPTPTVAENSRRNLLALIEAAND